MTFDPKSTTQPAAKPLENRNPYDPDTPQALVDFMLTGWEPAPTTAPKPIADVEAFARRRRALSAQFPGQALVIPTGREKVRSNDTHFRFRPGSDFYYLTGNVEPDVVLVMLPRASGGHEDVLFVEPTARTDATFFTDRVKGELWVGPRLGVELSRARFGIDACRSIKTLPDALAALRGGAVRVRRGFDPLVDDALPRADDAGKKLDDELATALSEMRLIKDEVEVRELQRAVDATRRGFEDVIRSLPGARSERRIEGVFNLRAREEGNDVGYGTIAACGPHACTLHWTKNNGPVTPGELLLLDAGVEGDSLYTADITRVLPISGKFTPEQRTIYELVLKAQRAAIAAVRPGADFLEPNRVAMRILAEGLQELGVLGVTAEASLKEDCQLHRRYTLHNVSHMLGLDVHDCAKARQESYKLGKLRAGIVMTVEPGLYFQPDDLTVPERFRGIGVRIEDDVLVTETGCRILSADIPVLADDVERWMDRLWASPG